jgi:hypothetical protein
VVGARCISPVYTGKYQIVILGSRASLLGLKIAAVAPCELVDQLFSTKCNTQWRSVHFIARPSLEINPPKFNV